MGSLERHLKPPLYNIFLRPITPPLARERVRIKKKSLYTI